MPPVGDARDDLIAEVLQDGLERLALGGGGGREGSAKIARRDRRDDGAGFYVAEIIGQPVDDLVTVTAKLVVVRGATSLP